MLKLNSRSCGPVTPGTALYSGSGLQSTRSNDGWAATWTKYLLHYAVAYEGCRPIWEPCPSYS